MLLCFYVWEFKVFPTWKTLRNKLSIKVFATERLLSNKDKWKLNIYIIQIFTLKFLRFSTAFV